jgi:CcmD family protein
MPNLTTALTSIVAAYSIIFIAIFIFTWTMFSRQRKIEKKLEEIRAELKENARGQN